MWWTLDHPSSLHLSLDPTVALSEQRSITREGPNKAATLPQTTSQPHRQHLFTDSLLPAFNRRQPHCQATALRRPHQAAPLLRPRIPAHAL